MAEGLTLWLELTPRCDLACAFCYNPWRPGPKRDQPGPVATSVYAAGVKRLLARRTFDYVALSGGEPLLHPDLDTFVALVAEHDQRPVLTTNGRLLTRSRIERLADAGLAALQVPLLARKPEVHDGLAGRASWRSALLALALGLEYGLSTAATFILTHENANELVGVVDTLAELGVDNLVVNELHATGSASSRADLAVPASLLRRSLARARVHASKRGVSLQFVPASDAAVHGTIIGGWYRLAVSPAAELKLCNQSIRSLGELAAIEDDGLDRILADVDAGRLAAYGDRVDHCSCFDRLTRSHTSLAH